MRNDSGITGTADSNCRVHRGTFQRIIDFEEVNGGDGDLGALARSVDWTNPP